MSRVFFKEKEGNHKFWVDRVQYKISDTFSLQQSDTIQDGIKIEITGNMKREEMSSASFLWNGGQRNIIGTLYFTDNITSNPSESIDTYMKIEDVYVMSFQETSVTWREWGTVSITLMNENMWSKKSVIAQFTNGEDAVDVYNPSFIINQSTVRKNFSKIPNWNGSFWQDTGYEIVKARFTGTIPWDSCDFPEKIVGIFENFEEIQGEEGRMMVPKEQSLNDFIPTIRDIILENIFIESANLVWDIENKTITVEVNFVGPHQDIKEQ